MRQIRSTCEIHPGEAELARFSEGEGGADVAEHLRWCARCRGVIADYRWLQEEIGGTLAAAVDAMALPRSKWWIVQERISATRRRRVAGWRASAIASVVSAVCLMLLVSPVPGTTVVARTLPPEPMVAPSPVAVVVSGESGEHLMATPTPAISRDGTALSPTPALILPPTPLESEI